MKLFSIQYICYYLILSLYMVYVTIHHQWAVKSHLYIAEPIKLFGFSRNL